MIVGKVYSGDNNETLKWVQHDLYSQIMPEIFRRPKERFVKAARLVEYQQPLIDILKNITSFDHRVLQNAHDIVAARYRYLHDDFGQMLLFCNLSQEDRYRRNWSQWFHKEIKVLTDYNNFTRAAVKAVAFENSKMGYAAKDNLENFLASYYSMGDWAYHEFY